MIAEILKRKSPYAVLRYCLNDKKNGIENRAEIIGGNIMEDTAYYMADDYNFIFQNESKYNGKKPFKPVRHIVFNPDDQDRNLSDEEINEITEQWLDQMGYTNNPYTIIKHKDENKHGKEHWHVITTKYKYNNYAVNENNDYYKNNRLCRNIEEEYNLKPNEGISNNYIQCTNYDKDKRDEQRKRKKVKNVKKQHEDDPQYRDHAQSELVNNNQKEFGYLYLKKLYNVNIDAGKGKVKYCKKFNSNLIKTKLYNGDLITDKKQQITTGSQDPKDTTIKMMAIMAKQNGYTKVKVYGDDQFLKKAWKALEDQNIGLNIQDDQLEIYKQYKQEQQQLKAKSKKQQSKKQQPRPTPANTKTPDKSKNKDDQEDQPKSTQKKSKGLSSTLDQVPSQNDPIEPDPDQKLTGSQSPSDKAKNQKRPRNPDRPRRTRKDKDKSKKQNSTNNTYKPNYQEQKQEPIKQNEPDDTDDNDEGGNNKPPEPRSRKWKP